MKKFTALALVAGLSATGAQAQSADLQYDANTGEVSIIVTGGIINYVLESSDAIFIPANHTDVLRSLVTIPGVGTFPAKTGTTSSTTTFLGESEQEGINADETLNIGAVLPAGLSEQDWNAVPDSVATYVPGLGQPAQPFNLTYIPVPEPTSLALLGLGGLLVARRRRG